VTVVLAPSVYVDPVNVEPLTVIGCGVGMRVEANVVVTFEYMPCIVTAVAEGARIIVVSAAVYAEE
jgi:hypothetical protein